MSEPEKSGFKFDPTINAGHLLTFAGFLISGFIAYTSLDKRVVVIEQRTENLDRRLSENNVQIKETLGEMKQDLRELKSGINQIARNGSKATP